MIQSKKIGRLKLMKYCLISLAIILGLPILIALFYNTFTSESLPISTYYSNMTKGLVEDYGLLAALIVLMSFCIWFIGGLTGKLIIEKNKSKFLVGFMTFFSLWMLMFICLTLLNAIKKSFTWGFLGFKSVVSGWVIYGLFMFLIFGIVHGLTMGYFYGNELKKKKRHANNGYSA
jgi:hypothetical protein